MVRLAALAGVTARRGRDGKDEAAAPSVRIARRFRVCMGVCGGGRAGVRVRVALCASAFPAAARPSSPAHRARKGCTRYKNGGMKNGRKMCFSRVRTFYRAGKRESPCRRRLSARLGAEKGRRDARVPPPMPYGGKVITRCGESGICRARAADVQGAGNGRGQRRGYSFPSSSSAGALPSAVRASAVYFAKSRRAFSSAPGIALKPASSGEAVMTNCCGTMVA